MINLKTRQPEKPWDWYAHSVNWGVFRPVFNKKTNEKRKFKSNKWQQTGFEPKSKIHENGNTCP